MSRRFPFPIPFGWFQVAYPEDLAPGEVTPLHYFGRELVLWRDDGGEFHLQDAFCPHLGAHLGHGGTVHGDELACPFHGWKLRRRRRVHEHPVQPAHEQEGEAAHVPGRRAQRLRDGVVPPGRAKRRSGRSRSCSEYDDPAFSDYFRSSYVIHTVPQEMSENGADPAHFLYVHGTETVAEMESYEIDGPRSTMLSKQCYVTPRGTTWGRIDVYNHGPGFSAVWFSGIVDAMNVATTTPIDDETTQVRFNFTVRKFDDEKMTSRVAEAFVAEINKQVQEDRPIWEHKPSCRCPRSPTPTARSSSSASGTASSTPSPTRSAAVRPSRSVGTPRGGSRGGSPHGHGAQDDVGVDAGSGVVPQQEGTARARGAVAARPRRRC